MKSAGYVVLFTIAGCSQGVCRSNAGGVPGPAPGLGPSAAEPAVIPISASTPRRAKNPLAAATKASLRGVTDTGGGPSGAL